MPEASVPRPCAATPERQPPARSDARVQVVLRVPDSSSPVRRLLAEHCRLCASAITLTLPNLRIAYPLPLVSPHVSCHGKTEKPTPPLSCELQPRLTARR
jgi:hypothetical protein